MSGYGRIGRYIKTRGKESGMRGWGELAYIYLCKDNKRLKRYSKTVYALSGMLCNFSFSIRTFCRGDNDCHGGTLFWCL